MLRNFFELSTQIKSKGFPHLVKVFLLNLFRKIFKEFNYLEIEDDVQSETYVEHINLYLRQKNQQAVKIKQDQLKVKLHHHDRKYCNSTKCGG